jgi:ligand-binding sensor domain-containing protein/two-component sensor histidine kinase
MTERAFSHIKRSHFIERGILCLCLVINTAVLIHAERLPVHVYRTADGLGSSAVNWILRDSRGFLWFGTRDGLSRFDGQSFTTYRIEHSSSPSVSQIIERRRGDYLVVLQSGAVYRFDAQTHASTESSAARDDTVTLHAERVSDDVPGGLFEDHTGRLWVIGMGGLYLTSESDHHLTSRPIELRLPGRNPPVTNITRIIEARDGSLWLLTNLGLVRRAEDGRVMLYGAPPAMPVASFLSTLFEDSQGRIWIASHRGVYVLKPLPLDHPAAFVPHSLTEARRNVHPLALPAASGALFEFTTMEGFDGELIQAIYQTTDGRIWLTGKNALNVFDGRQFMRFNADSGLGTKFGMMAEDVDGNLWLTSMNGAAKLVTRGLTTYGKYDGLGDQTIKSIYQTPAGDFYVVSGDWQVSRREGAKFVTVRPHLDAGTPLWTSNVAFLDSAGAWWFLTERKLFRFDHAQPLEVLDGLRPSAVYANGADFHYGGFYMLFEDARGRIWISSRSTASEQAGLTIWQRTSNTFHTFGPAENFPEGRRAPSAFCEDRAGNLWLGFYYGDVARYANGKFTLLTSKDGIPEGTVTALHLDKRGRLWIASSGGGLSRVDDPTAAHPIFVNYSTANGLSSNNVRQITEDDAGRIYAGTVRGIDRLSPDTGRIKHYTMADGLADDFITVAFRAHDGALWFGTQNGLSRLVPEPDLPTHAPPVMIGGLRVAGVKQPLSELGQNEVEQLELTYNQANLQIDFFSLSFASAERIRYQHKLDGADKDWSGPAGERTVVYANLAPGTYRFLVRAVNADGVLSPEPAVVSFRIAPPVWSRWWFILSAVLLFGVIVFWVARISLRRKLELERVRTRIATDLHDDIGASLTRIAMLSEVTRRQQGDVPPESAQRLTQIADNARSVVDSMSDIVWAIDPRRDDFLSVIERVRSFAADTLGAALVRWQFTVAPRLEERRLTPEQRRALYLIFKEAISNIARHAECRNASFQLSLEHATLVALIEDDGCGMQDEPTGNGRAGRGGQGLRNMKARAAEIGGLLAIESRAGGGTRLRLTMPLSADMNMLLRIRRR